MHERPVPLSPQGKPHWPVLAQAPGQYAGEGLPMSTAGRIATADAFRCLSFSVTRLLLVRAGGIREGYVHVHLSLEPHLLRHLGEQCVEPGNQFGGAAFVPPNSMRRR